MEGELPSRRIQIHPHNSVGCKRIRQRNRDTLEAQVSQTPRARHSALHRCNKARISAGFYLSAAHEIV